MATHKNRLNSIGQVPMLRELRKTIMRKGSNEIRSLKKWA